MGGSCVILDITLKRPAPHGGVGQGVMERTMKILFRYLKCKGALAASGAAVKFISTIVLLLIPFTVEHVIDVVVPTKNLWSVLFWGLIMVLLAVVERWLNLWSSRIAVKVAQAGTYAMRQDLFERAIDLSGAQVDRFGLPSLTARLTSDIYNVQAFLELMPTFCMRAPTLVLGSLLLTLIMDLGLALILCVIAPVMIAAVALVSWKGIPLYAGVQRRVDGATRILRENITGVRVIKALSKEEHEIGRFDKANGELERSECKAGDIMSLPGPLSTLFLNIGLVLIVWVGANRVDSGATQPGVILAFLTFFNMILMGVMGLNRIFGALSKANASANRIAAVLAQPDELPVIEDVECGREDGFIVFDKVSFHYGDQMAEGQEMSLKDISFAVKKGGSLGIIGTTGSGKTTIVNLLMRFYDPTEGRVYVDGKDVRGYDKDELRRRFGTVFQNDTVFADTLAENISFGRGVGAEAIRAAADHAQAREFIEGYADTYDHRVAAHGADLSGGQRQRLLIARALAGEPEVLILDDASSALDYRTDAALRAAIREHHGDVTTIVVAQRISSILDSDEILMLDEGRIIGRGTHEQLLRTCPRYRDVYKAQMGEEGAVM